MSTEHPLRRPCSICGGTMGHIDTRNGQDCTFCDGCGRFQYNAPRVETGKQARTVATVHNGVKPNQRARILQRATGRCEVCGARGVLHVGHLVSVEKGLALGMTEAQLNDDENLCCLCEECNLGIGREPIPLRFAVAMVLARVTT